MFLMHLFLSVGTVFFSNLFIAFVLFFILYFSLRLFMGFEPANENKLIK